MSDAKRERGEMLDALAEAGGLRPEVAASVAKQTQTAEAEVYGVGSFYHLVAEPDVELRVCTGLSCQIAGADALLAAKRAEGIKAEPCSCLAECDRAPAMMGRDRRVGGVPGHIGAGARGSANTLAMHLAGAPTYDCEALLAARQLGTDEVIARIDSSGLQGRGGAGFPAAFKWRSVQGQAETTRYVVLNADEGEPGTFKDRELLMRRPDKVVEGLAIAAEAVGAGEIYLYLRGAFEALRARLTEAIDAMKPHLGELQFHLHRGQGAYICGEETALLESLEGRRGMPRLKPPFPTEQGLWGKPTLMHNVETIACVPAIVTRGGDWFRGLGRTEAGTKLYCISGHVAQPGTYELPLGVSLDELVEAAGGYVGELLCFSPGGASSGFLPASERGRPLDYKSLAEVGSMLGSAGVVVLNTGTDMNAAIRSQLVFFEDESCGQCAPCRIGTRVQREAFDRHIQGDATALDIARDVAWEMVEGSICGLGQTAASPLISILDHLPEAVTCPSKK